MLIKEFYGIRADGTRLYRIYSDNNKKILQNETNITYTDVIDIDGAPYTYTELDEIIITPDRDNVNY